MSHTNRGVIPYPAQPHSPSRLRLIVVLTLAALLVGAVGLGFVLGRSTPPDVPVRVVLDAAQWGDGGQLVVAGTLHNDGHRPVAVSAAAFSFLDSAGQSYAVSSSPLTLDAQSHAPLHVAVPVPRGRGLTLIVTVPPHALAVPVPVPSE